MANACLWLLLIPCSARLGASLQVERASPTDRDAAWGHQAPAFEVDLDVAPEKRWRQYNEYWLPTGIIQAMTEAQNKVRARAGFPADVQQQWRDAILAQVPDDLIREAKGIADDWSRYHPSMNYSYMSVLSDNFIYEQNFPTFCSGVVAAMPNGTTVHGRNMDYPLDIQWKGRTVGWPELTSVVTFKRGGKPLFVSVTWPGQLGIHTGMRFDGWSFEQNTRRLLPAEAEQPANLRALQQGALGYVLKVRKVMEEVADFEEAVSTIYATNFAATSYFIMAGPKPYQGAVLSIDSFGQHLKDTPPIFRLNPAQWSTVQTNDDYNHPAQDYRRPVEQFALAKAQQAQVGIDWMWSQVKGPALSTPVNAFTALFVPASNFWEVRLPAGTIDLANMEGA